MAYVGKITIDSFLLLSDSDFLFLETDEELLLDSFSGLYSTLIARYRKLNFFIPEGNKERLEGPSELITEHGDDRPVITEKGNRVILELTSELVIMFVIKARKILFDITE